MWCDYVNVAIPSWSQLCSSPLSIEVSQPFVRDCCYCLKYRQILTSFLELVSSVRSSYSHPDLLVIQHPTHFFRSHRSSTLDFHFLSHYSYIKARMLYKSNHWTGCAGFMDSSWVRLCITDDDLGTSWALPGDNLGMTWGWLGHYM